VLATLPTLDESGVVVRQTGGRDPLRGVQIPGVPAGGPQPASGAPSVGPAMAPSSMDRGKGPASSSSALGGTGGGGSEEERRRRLRRADGLLVLNPAEASEDWWWGRGGWLPGPGRAEARQSSATITIGPTATTTTTAIGPAATTTTWG
jgi:hypothetical protein